jgi:hypothetical protein
MRAVPKRRPQATALLQHSRPVLAILRGRIVSNMQGWSGTEKAERFQGAWRSVLVEFGIEEANIEVWCG